MTNKTDEAIWIIVRNAENENKQVLETIGGSLVKKQDLIGKKILGVEEYFEADGTFVSILVGKGTKKSLE